MGLTASLPHLPLPVVTVRRPCPLSAGLFSADVRGATCEVRVAAGPVDYEQQQRHRLRLRLRSTTLRLHPDRNTATVSPPL